MRTRLAEDTLFTVEGVKTEVAAAGGIIPYQTIYYCSPAVSSSTGTLAAMVSPLAFWCPFVCAKLHIHYAGEHTESLQVLVGLWLALLFMSLAHIAEVYLTSAMGTLAHNLKLPPRLAGVTLLAWANGAPDIAANIAAMRSGNIRMALGSAIGAGMFVTCLIAGRLAHMARSMRVKGAMVCFHPTEILVNHVHLFHPVC